MKKIIDGICVEVSWRKVKKIRIKIDKYKGVQLVIPNGVSEKTGIAFLNKNLDWVKTNLAKRPAVKKFDFCDGAGFFFFGKEVSLRVVKSQRKSFILNPDEIILYNPSVDKESIKSHLFDILKKILRDRSKLYFDKWESLTGLKSTSLRVTQAQTRWGSCNCQTRAINLSVYLACMPEFCLDYVILHEISHIRYANHGQQFKAMLTKYMPEWRAVRDFMKNNSSKMKLYV